MKAVMLRELGGPDKLRLEEIEKPEPGAGEIRIKLIAAALNRRDYFLTYGQYWGMQLPCVPGSDGAGVVDAVGAGVAADWIGNEVVIYPLTGWGDDERCHSRDYKTLGMPGQGTFAEYICVPAENVFAKPAHLDWEQAAAVPLAGLTSWRAVVRHAEPAPGRKILVTGAGGGVATFAVQWAVQHGAEVYVTSSDERKIKLAQSLGAVAGINYRDEDCYKTLCKISGGFDAIIDSAGGNTINPLLDTLNPAGRFIFYGATLGNADDGLPMAKLFYKHIRIQGTTMGTLEEFGAMLRFVSEKKIEPVLDRVFPLAEAAAAHQHMGDFGQTGKIVLRNLSE